MSFLRGSANYVWCTTSVLGKGATGAVFQVHIFIHNYSRRFLDENLAHFQGVNKHNGETVAVKTFNQLSHMRPQEVQMREFEVSLLGPTWSVGGPQAVAEDFRQ